MGDARTQSGQGVEAAEGEESSAAPAYGQDCVRFSFPPKPELVSVARALAASLAEQHGMVPSDVENVRLLVSEAVTNALRTHRDVDAATPITLICSIDGSEFRLEVIDAGGGMDLNPRMGFPDVSTGDGEEGGFGIPLMCEIATESHFGANDAGGTTVALALDTQA